MSVLADFYNLELDTSQLNHIKDWKTPEKDRQKIVEFFERHAPEVLRYRTAAEIERQGPQLGVDIIGTLGYFEYRKKQSWFDNFDILNFYHDYKWLHSIIDSYLEGKTHESTAAFLDSLLRDVRMFTKKDSWGIEFGIVTSTSSDLSKEQLNLGRLHFKLCTELLSLLNGKIEVRKCEAEDCDKIFIPNPSGKEQRFCSNACKQKAYRKRKKLS